MKISHVFIGIIALVVILNLVIDEPLSSSSNNEVMYYFDKKVDKGTARASCETWIKESLKAPATAKFKVETLELSGGVWRGVFQVDSENSFGAFLRSEWRCDIHAKLAVVEPL